MDTLIIFAAKYLFAIVAVLAIYAWWQLPKELRLRVAIQAILGLSFAAVLVKVAGALVPEARPFVANHFVPLVAQNPDNSFPSDHTTFTMLAAFTILPFARRWGWALASLALIVGLGRIAAGVHWPLDIVGGTVVAAVSAAGAYYVAKWIVSTWQTKQTRRKA